MTYDPCLSSPETPRPNPVSYAGSLIYWLEVPSDQQHFIQGILEGYDDLGYYQTMIHGYREDAGGEKYALARITAVEGARREVEAVIEVLSGEYGFFVLENAPDIPPDAQPRSRKLGGPGSDGS